MLEFLVCQTHARYCISSMKRFPAATTLDWSVWKSVSRYDCPCSRNSTRHRARIFSSLIRALLPKKDFGVRAVNALSKIWIGSWISNSAGACLFRFSHYCMIVAEDSEQMQQFSIGFCPVHTRFGKVGSFHSGLRTIWAELRSHISLSGSLPLCGFCPIDLSRGFQSKKDYPGQLQRIG